MNAPVRNALERRCRLLLRAYPARYRRERGEEILGTALESVPPGRNWPAPREAGGLILGGLRPRAAQGRREGTAASLRQAAMFEHVVRAVLPTTVVAEAMAVIKTLRRQRSSKRSLFAARLLD